MLTDKTKKRDSYLKFCASWSIVNSSVWPFLWYDRPVICSVVSCTSWSWWGVSVELDGWFPCPNSSTGCDKTSAICSERDWCFVAFNQTIKMIFLLDSLQLKNPQGSVSTSCYTSNYLFYATVCQIDRFCWL